MSEGFFIGLGDKTSCGGEVLDGDPRINLYGLLHACEGDRVTCGINGKTYRIVGGISHMESHGRLMAGTLDSRSNCPCKATLTPSVYTARYVKQPSAAQPMRRTAEATPTSAPRPTPQPSSFTLSSQPAAAPISGFAGAEPGFYIVPKSTTREALEATLFPTRDPVVMRKFQALNPHRGEVKAGSMIVLSDPRNFQCSREEAVLMQAAAETHDALAPLSAEDANFMFRHAAEIVSYTGETSTWLGVSAVVMEKHLTKMRNTLQDMELLHQESYRRHGHLRSQSFFDERKRLMTQLDAHLLNSTRLRGQTTLGDHPKLKTALGISSRSLVHHWDKAGGPGQIPGYATHVSSTSRAVQYMKTGGVIGIGIGGISSGLAVLEVCRADSGTACERVAFEQGGKFLGSTFGGWVGGELGLRASGPICLALGISTGVGGVVCVASLVGVGAWLGTTEVAEGGEKFGATLYELTRP
ncbi:PAAR domain-containing protein [Pseudomonas sp. Pse1]|uniref:PAAR domain-containing protein n=1 Tax=Pseudomonas sp. Pse1 TaxID=2926020 RepID=UPI0021194FFA|nr:PAAR domain-containing protein [Pseudomonas sp. Pse1]